MQLSIPSAGSLLIKEKALTILFTANPDLTSIEPTIVLCPDLKAEKAVERYAERGSRVFSRPGEYEVGGAFINGLSGEREDGSKSTFYVVTIAGLHFCLMEGVAQSLDSDQVEDMGGVDLLAWTNPEVNDEGVKPLSELVKLISPKGVLPLVVEETFVKALSDQLKLTPEEAVDQLKLTRSELSDRQRMFILRPTA